MVIVVTKFISDGKPMYEIDFSDWKQVENLRSLRLQQEITLWKRIKEGDQDAHQKLLDHQKEDRKLIKKAASHGYVWN